MGWDRQKMREKIFSFRTVFSRHGLENCKKNSKKIQNFLKQYPGFISSRNETGQDEKKRNFILFYFQSELFLLETSYEILKKIAKKIQKIKKYHFGCISTRNESGQAEKERIFFHSELIYPTRA